MAELTEELRVLVTAEVDRAIKQLGSLDKKTKSTESEFKKLGQVIGSAFATKEIIAFSQTAIKAWENSQQTVRTLGAVLKSTGAEAWTSSEELQKMASSLQDLTGIANDSIISMQSVLLGFKNINGDNFKEATKAILDMSAVMGMDLKSAAQSIGKALDDPINGMDSLRKQGFKFTDAQKKVMQSMIDTGNIASAQKIILDELNGTFGGAAEAAVTASTKLRNALSDLQKEAGGMLAPLQEDLAGFALDIVKSFGEMDEGTKDFIAGMLEVVAVSAPTILAIKGLTVALTALSANPAAIAIMAAVTGVALLGGAIKKSKGELDSLAKSFEATSAAERNLLDSYSSGNREKLLDKDTTDKLLELYPELTGKITAYGTSVEEAAKAARELNNQKLIDASSSGIKNYLSKLEEIEKVQVKIDKIKNRNNSMDADALKNYEAQKKAQLEIAETLRAQINEKIKITGKQLLPSGKLDDLPPIEIPVIPTPPGNGNGGSDAGLSDKTWQAWWEKITGVSTTTFNTGKEAAEQYIKGLESALSTSSDISEALGETFNVSEVLESQMEEVRKVIQQLLTIPADKIDDPFKIYNGSIEELIAKYGELENARNRALVDKEISEMQVKVDSLNKSEWDLIETRLKDVDATEEQIKKYKELFDLLHAEDEDIPTWQDKVKEKMTGLIEDLDMFDAKTQIVLANMATAFATAMPETTLSGFRSFGEALGEGADASEALGAALADMAEQILNQLPMMFLQAGLQLIAQGQWPLGLGFIAAAGSTSIMAGYVQSKKSSSTKENALGGVYGEDSYSAFAKGGYFTNQIVDSPTYFRFAKGSGFGTGLMGEAGPEAIMPLTRGSDGSLGVRAEGVGSNVAIALNVRINNYSNEKVDVQESTDESGQKQLEVTIGAMFNQHITSGKADKAFKSRYGLEAQGY